MIGKEMGIATRLGHSWLTSQRHYRYLLPTFQRRLNSSATCSYRIEATASGWGVIAHRSWLAGEKVLSTTTGTSTVLYVKQEPDSHTLQIGPRLHAVLGLPARFLNHSCDANLAMSPDVRSINAVEFIARRNIHASEELTFDYETTEGTMDEPFLCQCGASNCRGTIQGFEYRQTELLNEEGKKWIASHLLA